MLPRVLLPLVLVLLSGNSSTARAERLFTVGIDLSPVTEARFKELELLSLQRKLAVRLTQAGFAVVDVKRYPDITLVFITEGEKTVAVHARSIASKPDLVDRASASGSMLTYHLELIHKAVELARVAAEGLSAQSLPTSRSASLPASRPTSQPTPASQPVPPVSSPAKAPLELAVGPVALYRIHGTDALLRVGGRLGLWRQMGLRLSAVVSPSVVEALWALEWGLQGGTSFRWQLFPKLHFEVGALLGFLHHAYGMRDSAWSPAFGSHWDFIASLTLELGWRISRRLSLRLWLAPGFTEQTRIHHTGPAAVWERSFFRLEGGLLAVVHLR